MVAALLLFPLPLPQLPLPPLLLLLLFVVVVAVAGSRLQMLLLLFLVIMVVAGLSSSFCSFSRSVVSSSAFCWHHAPLLFALGFDVPGTPFAPPLPFYEASPFFLLFFHFTYSFSSLHPVIFY